MPLEGNPKINISASIDFPGEYIPSQILTRTIDNLERAIHESEWYELVVLASETLFEDPVNPPEMPPLFINSLRWGHHTTKGQSLLIKERKSGSVVIEAAIAGIAIYILKTTLGETLKDAWKESKIHEKLKDILLLRKKERCDTIAQNFQDFMKEDDQLDEPFYNININIPKIEERAAQIDIKITFDENYNYITERSNLLEDLYDV